MALATGQPLASISMLPLLARSSPARIRNSVDFPQPLGPTMQQNSPGAIVRSMPSSATTRSRPSPYSLRKPAIAIAAPRRSCVIRQILSTRRVGKVPGTAGVSPASSVGGRDARGPGPQSAATFELGVLVGGNVWPKLFHREVRITQVDQALGREFGAHIAVLDEPVLHV